jgi:hypothetical protein
MKKSGVFDWHKHFERVVRTWKMRKEVVIQDLKELMKNVEKVQNLVPSDLDV